MYLVVGESYQTFCWARFGEFTVRVPFHQDRGNYSVSTEKVGSNFTYSIVVGRTSTRNLLYLFSAKTRTRHFCRFSIPTKPTNHKRPPPHHKKRNNSWRVLSYLVLPSLRVFRIIYPLNLCRYKKDKTEKQQQKPKEKPRQAK